MKFRKGSLLMDIIIAVMFMGTVMYSAFTLGSGSINKKIQVEKEREALLIAENIMAKTLSVGFNHMRSIPSILVSDRERIASVENGSFNNLAAKRKTLYELPYYVPVPSEYISNSSSMENLKHFKYHVLIDAYDDPVRGKATKMCKVTVRVFYPIVSTKYDTTEKRADEEYDDYVAKDKTLRESDYRYVELYSYKTAKN